MQKGLSIGEILYKNDAQKLQALDIEKNKKNRVTATQFASEEAIAHTSRSPRSDSIIEDEGENVKQMFSVADADDSWGVDRIGKETGEADSSPAAQNDKTRGGRQIAGATEGNGGRSMSAPTEERGRQSAVPVCFSHFSLDFLFADCVH